jgi:peptidyl-prolyl cis-trans isomerase A (cyclophilin A)
MPRMSTIPCLALAAVFLAPPDAPEKAAPKAKDTYAVFVTSRGKIAARLLPGDAPVGVRNFVELATGKKEWTDPRTQKPTRAPLYDGTLFHRVIPGFMIQGGDPMTRGQPTEPDMRYGVSGPGYRFADEIKAGATPFADPCQLAYANSGPNTNGSQFFITEVPTAHLNPRACPGGSGVCGYVRFGTGVCGCERVREIAAAGPAKVRLEKVLVVHEKPSCD